jgi:hypothetical protein
LQLSGVVEDVSSVLVSDGVLSQLKLLLLGKIVCRSLSIYVRSIPPMFGQLVGVLLVHHLHSFRVLVRRLLLAEVLEEDEMALVDSLSIV